MSTAELLDKIRAALDPKMPEGAIHDTPTLSLHPDDWEYLKEDPPRSLFEDGETRAIFGCKVLLDDSIEPGTAVAE